jgi:dihydrolipoamide dehydrogenase
MTSGSRTDAQAGDSEAYDVVVIGAGPVGENVADYAHRGGLSVVVVERELVGGECSYWACIPSKALLRPVQALAAARRLAGAAPAVTGPVDPAAVLARRDTFVHDYDDAGQVGWLEGAGIALVRGVGRIAGERRVAVRTGGGDRVIEARRAVVVCTGSAAVLPAVPGLAEAGPWTSREVTALRQVPRRFAVIGGGVVSLEMAAAVKGLGAEQVTVLVRGDRVLEQVEPFAGELVVEGLRESGVDVRFRTSARLVTRVEGGPVRLELDDGSTLEADELLVATGRRPRTDDLGVETVGLEPGHHLRTDDGLAVEGVGGGWLFAAGDVTGRVLLTHQGKYQARLLGDRLAADARGEAPDLQRWGAHAATADDAAVPQVVFTDPEVAAVGLTQRQADDRGLRTRLVTYDLGSVAGAALAADGYRGRAGLLVDLDRDVVVGATFVGPDVAELLHSATVAIVGEVPLSRLWHAVPSFPTISEVWLRLLEELRTSA